MRDDIEYKIGVDASDVEKGAKKAEKKLKDLGSNGSKSLDKLKVGGTLATGALVGIGVAAGTTALAIKTVTQGIEDFNVQARAENKLESVLKSTKNAAGLTSIQLKQMASALQGVTAVGDETIINAQALMLTFTNIGKEIFPRATEAALNMSHALDQDLTTSTTMLSKALNDPIAGLNAMSRAGVQFTKEQKLMVKQLVETGNALEAQKIILDEVDTQFGNSARNFRKTFEGTTISIGNLFGDMSEKVGEGFAEETTGGLTDLLASLTDASPELQSLAKSFGSIAGSLLEVPLTALTEWTDLFHAYSAGSTAAMKNPLLKNVAELQDELKKELKIKLNTTGSGDIGTQLTNRSLLNNYGGVDAIEDLFESAAKGNVESLRTISTNKDLNKIYESMLPTLNKLQDAFSTVTEAIQAGTLNKKDGEDGNTGTSKNTKVTYDFEGINFIKGLEDQGRENIKLLVQQNKGNADIKRMLKDGKIDKKEMASIMATVSKDIGKEISAYQLIPIEKGGEAIPAEYETRETAQLQKFMADTEAYLRTYDRSGTGTPEHLKNIQDIDKVITAMGDETEISSKNLIKYVSQINDITRRMATYERMGGRQGVDYRSYIKSEEHLKTGTGTGTTKPIYYKFVKASVIDDIKKANTQKVGAAIKKVDMSFKTEGQVGKYSDYGTAMKYDPEMVKAMSNTNLVYGSGNEVKKTQEEFLTGITSMTNSTTTAMNSMANTIKQWSEDTNTTFAEGMARTTSVLSTLSSGAQGVSRGLQDSGITGALGSLIPGLGLAAAGFGLISGFASIFGNDDDNQAQADTSSNSTSRANIVSNGPENVYQTINATINTNYLGDDVGLQQFAQEIGDIYKESASGIL